ncbi:MAG: hypothetical protein M1822_005202 [Bathelium mastoideum]|nr:MAG: hypothetical protein M1822_005202 [Bathelium mastoideum]
MEEQLESSESLLSCVDGRSALLALRVVRVSSERVDVGIEPELPNPGEASGYGTALFETVLKDDDDEGSDDL